MNTETNQSGAESQPSCLGAASCNFYRYEAVEYASLGIDGDYESSKIPNPKVELKTYNLFKETPKGYWIGYGSLGNRKLRGHGHWVSKTSKKRFAYPTKKEALENFIKRNEWRVMILKRQIWSCDLAIMRAKSMSI